MPRRMLFGWRSDRQLLFQALNTTRKSRLPTRVYDMCLRVQKVEGSKDIPNGRPRHIGAHDPVREQRYELVEANSKGWMQQANVDTVAIRSPDLEAIAQSSQTGLACMARLETAETVIDFGLSVD
jgi:hypothetical protein